MAEKIKIAEIDIDMEKAMADTIKLKEAQSQLRKMLKEAKDTTGEASAEYIQYDAALKATTAQLKSHEYMLQKTVESENAEKGSLDQLRAKLSVVSKEWAKLSEVERLNTVRGKELTTQKLALTTQLKKEEAVTGDARRNVGNYVSMWERLPGPIGKAASGIKNIGRTMSSFGPMGVVLGIVSGGLIKAAGLLTVFFTKSEKGFELMERKVAGFKAAWNVLVGEVISGGEKIADSLDKPEKKMNFLSRAVLALGSAFGVASPSVIALAARMDSAATAAEKYTQALQDLEDLQRGMIVTRAKTNRQIAEAKLLYEDETQSMSVRIAALKSSLDMELAMTNAEVEHQKKVVAQIEAVNEEKKKAGQLRDADLLKLEEAKAKEIELETESFTKQRKLQSTINKAYTDIANQRKKDTDSAEKAAEKELEAKRKAAEAAVKIMEIELDTWRKNNQEKISGAEKLTLDIVAAEIKRLKEQQSQEQAILKTQLDDKLISQAEYNAQLLNLEADKNAKIVEMQGLYFQQEKDKKLEALAINYENEQALLESNFNAQMGITTRELEKRKQAELANADKTGADKVLIEKKYAKIEAAINKAKANAKLSIAGSVADAIAELAGESTKIGKAAAVAGATIDTIQSAEAAFSGMVESFPGPWGIALGVVAAAAATAIGIANVKKILAVKTDLSSDGGGSSISTGGSATASPPPSSMITTQTSIGNGIVSRETVSPPSETSQQNTVLVVDDVTQAQRDETVKVKTSTL